MTVNVLIRHLRLDLGHLFVQPSLNLMAMLRLRIATCLTRVQLK